MQQEKIIRAFSKVKQDISFLTNEISNLKKEIQNNNIAIAELKGMMLVLIKERGASLVQPSANKVQKENIALPTKLKKGYKKKQILDEMQNLSNQGFSVTEIEQAIINRFEISRRTFYNYKKKLIMEVQV